MFPPVSGVRPGKFSSFFTKSRRYLKNGRADSSKRDCHQTLLGVFILLCVKIKGVLRHPENAGVFSPPSATR
ncbi:hypothetical protein, partial [Serratia sp. (in: enterobacteria)]|uniref:hypothetical protein n=1 Tax=Serratia sp. (in: enterobacteria) TaxID=616 RepID=UPI0039893CD2